MQKRRQFSAEFKIKVAIEALKEQQTLQELAKKYEVHPNQISSWKQEFLQNSASVFTRGKKKEEKEDTAKLYEEIGRQKVEVDRPALRFLKKKNVAKPVAEKKAMVNIKHPTLSISRQCELLGLSRLSASQSKRRESQADGRDR